MGDVALISMVKDDLDVLKMNLFHHLRNGLVVLLADHRSGPQAQALFQEVSTSYPQTFHRYLADFSGYHQAGVLTALAARAFENGADWVIPLDADEFLSEQQMRFFKATEPTFVGNLFWQNVWPTSLVGDEPLELDTEVEWDAELRRSFKKAAIPRLAWTHAPYVHVYQGGHDFWCASRGDLSSVDTGRLLHVPIRTLAQLVLKVRTGSTAYAQQWKHDQVSGHHWKHLHKEIGNVNTFDKFLLNDLRHFARDYGSINHDSEMVLVESAFARAPIGERLLIGPRAHA